jgi:hypothetical protein
MKTYVQPVIKIITYNENNMIATTASGDIEWNTDWDN